MRAQTALTVSLIGLSACGDPELPSACVSSSDCIDGEGCLARQCTLPVEISKQPLNPAPFGSVEQYLVHVRVPGAYYVALQYDADSTVGSATWIDVAVGEVHQRPDCPIGSDQRRDVGPFENVPAGFAMVEVYPGPGVTVTKLTMQLRE